MRRIVVIAAGGPGIACAVRIKHSLPECELNLVAPVSLPIRPSSSGPAGRRFAAELPEPELVSSRDITVLEARSITPDLARREILLGSSRGNLTIRYTDLVVEAPATVRVPRALQKADNIHCWPAPGLSANPEALDRALVTAAKTGGEVVVTGNGPSALEAVFLVREAGLKATWLRTGEKDSPDVDPQLLALILKRIKQSVTCVHLPDREPGQLDCRLNSAGNRLESISWPGGDRKDIACCLWTSPLMARHPLLREDGVFLDSFGRIAVSEDNTAAPDLYLVGSGAALPSAFLAGGAAQAPGCPGGEEAVGLSIERAVARICDAERICRLPFQGALGAQSAATTDIQCNLAGFSLAQAQKLGFEADQALSFASLDEDSAEPSILVLALVGDKKKRALLGLQVLGLGTRAAAAKGVFGAGIAALADSTQLETLIQRGWSGLPARLLGEAARNLTDKFDTVTHGIRPDEFIASRAAGAEFFTLDLRSQAAWREGHLPGAYNIPLIQLKKRLQDEVPRFTPLVLVCATGNDARFVASRLAALGATDIYVLDGGMALWPYAVEK